MKYELTIITPEETTELGIEQITRSVRRFSDSIITIENDGVKRLAYPIHGNERGRYLFYVLELNQGQPQALYERLNINDNVLRFLLVKSDTRYI